MAEHYINYETGANMNYDTNFKNLIKEIEKDDELIISFDGTDADKSSFVLDMLEKNGFEVLPKGGHENNDYRLVARKVK